MKQKAMVLDALAEGADHSAEIAEMTGLSLPTVSSYLSELERDGVVKKTGRWRREPGRAGRKSWVRRLTSGKGTE